MVKYYDRDLEAFFQEYVLNPRECEEYETFMQRFVNEIMSEDYGDCEMLVDDTDSSTRIGSELIAGKRYIRICDMARDLLVEICIDGIVDMLIVPESIKVSAVVSLVKFIRKLGSYQLLLDEEEKEFCKYLTTQKYTLADWVRYAPSGGIGFLREKAIDQYCEMRTQNNDFIDKEKLREKIEKYFEHLIEKRIIIQGKEPGRYIIRY